MRSFKLKGRKILAGEFISPDHVVAEFSDQVNPEDIFTDIEYGLKLAKICQKYKHLSDIKNIDKMLDEITQENLEYSYKKMKIRRESY